MPERFWKSAIAFLPAFATLVVFAALGAGMAAAQDYSAGKTPAQLFASDCSACHKSPAGLAKGMDARSLTSFLKEHYTTKQESATLLASYLASAGPGDAKQRAQAPSQESGARSKPEPKPPVRGAAVEAEPDQKPAPKPNVASEPQRATEEVSSTTIREEPQRHAARTPPASPGAKPDTKPDAIASKLKFYAASRGDAQETERLVDPVRKLDSYANYGSPAEAITSTRSDAANAGGAEVNAARRKPAEKKKKDATAAVASPAPAQPHRPAAPVTRPPPGN